MISAFAGDKRLIATCVYTKHSFIVRNILLDIGIAMGNTLDLLKPLSLLYKLSIATAQYVLAP